MYFLGLCYIPEKALWHLVITLLEDVSQDNSTVHISKKFRCFPDDKESVLFFRHYSWKGTCFFVSVAKWLDQFSFIFLGAFLKDS